MYGRVMDQVAEQQQADAGAVVIEAIQWEGGDYECLNDFCGLNWSRADAKDVEGPPDKENVVVWNTKEKQWLNLPLGHWLIRGLGGELYPCAPDIFAARPNWRRLQTSADTRYARPKKDSS